MNKGGGRRRRSSAKFQRIESNRSDGRRFNGDEDKTIAKEEEEVLGAKGLFASCRHDAQDEDDDDMIRLCHRRRRNVCVFISHIAFSNRLAGWLAG